MQAVVWRHVYAGHRSVVRDGYIVGTVLPLVPNLECTAEGMSAGDNIIEKLRRE
jgi:hypothetical protein